MIRNIFPAGSTILAARGRHAAMLSVALVLPMLVAGCDKTGQPVSPLSPTPRFTAGSALTPALIGRASFGAVKVKTKNDGWKASIDSDPLDVAVQTIVFAAGGHSGWHRHPGPVFVLVTQGQVSFYDSDDPTCTPTVVSASQGYLDTGEHVHILRNETQNEARVVATYLAPPAAALRVDAPDPGHCPFSQ